MKFTLQQIEERRTVYQGNSTKRGQDRDFLGKFLEIQENDPSIPDL